MYKFIKLILNFFIPCSKISTRKLGNYQIVFKSRQHLNLYLYKKYETNLWKKVYKYLPKYTDNSIFLDIGANIGQSAIILHSFFKKIQVISFEPSFNEYQYLKANILINNLNVLPHNAIVSNFDGNMKFSIDKETGGRTSRVAEYNEKDFVYCKTYSFPSLLEKWSPFFVKIDIEGHELNLFQDFDFFKFRRIHFLIEVRESTSSLIISKFLNTHKIYHIEKNNFINSVINIKFGNLLIISVM